MSENSESSAQLTSTSPSKPNSPTVPNKKISAERKNGSPKKALGKTTFRLPIALDRALRLASVMLEQMGEDVHTPTQMVEHAVTSYMEHLQNKKGVNFQGVIILKSSSTKSSSQAS
jgi:hypothetical protein